MPIVAAGITGVAELIGGIGAAGFGALDAGVAGLGLAGAGAGAAGAGGLAAADVAAGGLAADAALTDVAAPLAFASDTAAAGGGSLLGVDPLVGGVAGAGDLAPGALGGGGVQGSFDALAGGEIAGTSGYSAFPGFQPSLSGAPGFTGVVDAGTGAVPTAADVGAATGGQAISTLPGVSSWTTIPPTGFPGDPGIAAIDTAAGPGAGVGTVGQGAAADTAFSQSWAPGALYQAPAAATPADTGLLGQAGSMFKGAASSLGVTPMQLGGAALSAGALGYNLLTGNRTPPGEKQLWSAAAQSQQLLADYRAGKLPPGYKTAVDTAVAADIASIRSQYATRGMSGSSAEMQDIQRAYEQGVIMTAQIGQQILQGGLNAIGVNVNALNAAIAVDQRQTAATGQALANFAAAISGSGRQTITVKAA